MAPGVRVGDLFVIAQAKKGQARNGQTFWSLHLQDATGQVEAKIWSPLSLEFPDLTPGQLVFIEGGAGTFREQVQVTVESMRLIDAGADNVDMTAFVPASAEKPEDLLARLEDLARRNLHYSGWRKFVNKVLTDKEIRVRLLAGVGAKSIHHAYLGGLLEHTLAVCRLCLSICELYPHLDREVLLAAAIFHDLGKAWELSSGVTTDYTDEGRLLGHITISLQILEPFLQKAKLEPELALHFKHIIISHHGEYAFGSPRRPKTAEAFVLHYADNMDAKMNQIAAAFDDGPPGQEGLPPAWSPFQRSLDRFLYRPAPTPGNGRTHKSDDAKEQKQCSLLTKE